MSHWFEIRHEPLPSGRVIAIWHQEDNNLQLAFGVKNLTYPKELENEKRTYGMDDANTIFHLLVHEITEPEFSVHTEIMDIPQIISDGMLHYLGVLNWYHAYRDFGEDSFVHCSGDVYTKVVLKDPTF